MFRASGRISVRDPCVLTEERLDVFRTKSASRAFARLLACALCLAVWPMAVQAADKSQQAYWAGFAYTADAAAVQATTRMRTRCWNGVGWSR